MHKILQSFNRKLKETLAELPSLEVSTRFSGGKNRTYLAIYGSFYSHDKKGAFHKCYKSLGLVETLMKNGMEDPIAIFQKEVDALNSRERWRERVK